jgi:hypothetical protein
MSDGEGVVDEHSPATSKKVLIVLDADIVDVRTIVGDPLYLFYLCPAHPEERGEGRDHLLVFSLLS